MKKTLTILAIAGLLGIPAHLSAQRAKTGNPVLPEFHADPEILYAKQTKKYYIYSTTDGTPGWGGYYFTVFSSKDLTDWRHEGIMLDLGTDQVKWSDGNAWAPCIIEKKIDGKYKYFFYFSGNTPNGKAIGVATANHPCGPFTDAGHPIVDRRPEGQKHGQQIDVDVFEDPVSGKSYLYWGNGYMAGAELNEDMMSIKPETETLMTPQGGTLQDYVSCMNTDRVCIFTDTGRLHLIKITDMPFGRFRDKSIPLDNLGNYDSSGENIIHICNLASIQDSMMLFATKTGMLKLVKGSEFDVSKRTVAATKLADGDSIIAICTADNFNQLVLQTENGYFIRFPMMNIPEMKKTAIGVRGISLGSGDSVKAAYPLDSSQECTIIHNEKELLLNKLKLVNRGGKGTKVRV